MHRVAGYRRMVNYTQKDMANQLGVSETTYRNKEKGRIPFKDYEMILFQKVMTENNLDVSIVDIFFDNKLQKIQKRGIRHGTNTI